MCAGCALSGGPGITPRSARLPLQWGCGPRKGAPGGPSRDAPGPRVQTRSCTRAHTHTCAHNAPHEPRAYLRGPWRRCRHAGGAPAGSCPRTSVGPRPPAGPWTLVPGDRALGRPKPGPPVGLGLQLGAEGTTDLGKLNGRERPPVAEPHPPVCPPRRGAPGPSDGVCIRGDPGKQLPGF